MGILIGCSFFLQLQEHLSDSQTAGVEKLHLNADKILNSEKALSYVLFGLNAMLMPLYYNVRNEVGTDETAGVE